jgi:hypothetical protein
MLPKYRRLVERLAQAGLLKVICGTDTLGVGINVPIRTVVFTGLSKYDGTSHPPAQRPRVPPDRRAGRTGRVRHDGHRHRPGPRPRHREPPAAMRPRRATTQDKKVRKLAKKKPPPGRFVVGSEPTFDRLVGAARAAHVRGFTVTTRCCSTCSTAPATGRAAMRRLLTDNYETEANQADLQRAAPSRSCARSCSPAMVEELDEPDDRPDHRRVTVDLQQTSPSTSRCPRSPSPRWTCSTPSRPDVRPRRGLGDRGRARRPAADPARSSSRPRARRWRR